MTQRDPDQPNAEAALALIEDLDGSGDDEIAKVPISWPATPNFLLKGKLPVLYGGDN